MRVEIFDHREKIQPVPLDEVGATHLPARERSKALSLCLTASVGVRGQSPQLSFREASHGLPFFKRALSEWVSHWERSDLWRGQSPKWGQGVSPCKFHMKYGRTCSTINFGV